MTNLRDVTYYGFNKRIVADVMTKQINYIVQDVQDMVDKVMTGHGAEFVGDDDSDTGNPYFVDNDMYYHAHLEVLRQLCGYLWQCLPPVIEAHEAPFILPHQLVNEYTKQWFDDMVADSHDLKERLWKQRVLDTMCQELEDMSPNDEKREFMQGLIDRYRKEISAMKVYEVIANETG